LFTDTDFIVERNKIITKLKLLLGNEGYAVALMLIPKESLSDHLEKYGKKKVAKVINLMLPDQPELQFDENSLAANIIKDIDLVASKFQVSKGVVEQGIKYNDLVPELAFQSIPSVTLEDNQVVIRLNGSMKLSDIKTAYPQIKEMQQKLPDYKQRNRSKNDPMLIFAIHKKRLEGMSFREIYALYESGKLEGYTGSIDIIGEENLARNYRKFLPAT